MDANFLVNKIVTVNGNEIMLIVYREPSSVREDFGRLRKRKSRLTIRNFLPRHMTIQDKRKFFG